MKLIRGTKVSEANIQAEFYMACKRHNINCYLEYSVICTTKTMRKKQRKCRFDAVLYDKEDNIFAIIEIKSYHTHRPGNRATVQLYHYEQYGIPVFLITRIENIESTIKLILLLVP
jgi:hypothetical protein